MDTNFFELECRFDTQGGCCRTKVLVRDLCGIMRSHSISNSCGPVVQSFIILVLNGFKPGLVSAPIVKHLRIVRHCGLRLG